MTIAAPAVRPVLADLIPRPANLRSAALVDVGLIVAGVVIVSLLAKVSFYIGPVPITGQTAGVILVGATLGARRGAAALIAYMLVGLAGLPVFAGAVAGPAYVLAPSFGYILGFIPAAFVAGWFAERAWDRKPWLAFIGFVAASIVPFIIGVPYVAMILGVVQGGQVDFASIMGASVLPFIVPGLIKAAFVALVLPAAWLAVKAADRRKQR